MNANTQRLIDLLNNAERPLKVSEMALLLGLAEKTIRYHLAFTRGLGASMRIGGGAMQAFATPAMARATRDAWHAAKEKRRRIRRGITSGPRRTLEVPHQPRVAEWDRPAEAPGPNSIFAVGNLLRQDETT